MEKIITNTLVIGGGPGGYAAAIRLGQLGVKVVLAEKNKLGGTCLNVGCIPSKALINLSSKYYLAQHDWLKLGIKFNPQIDWKESLKWKDDVVSKTVSGVEFLVKANSVQYINANARLESKNTATVGDKLVEFENLILATGSSIVEIPDFKFDNKQILNSTDLLSLEKLPKSLIILGGGIIGMELGSIYLSLGAEVTIVEMLPNILPTYEPDAVNIIQKSFKEMGGEILTSHKALAVKLEKDGVKLKLEFEGKTKELKAEFLAVAVGRKANFEGLNLEALNIAPEKGKLAINDQFQTALSHVYAIGDIVDGPMLAHKATHEGVLVAEKIAGHKISRSDIKVIPDVVYTKPEIAQAGLSEKMAMDKNINIKTGKFHFTALGMATATQEIKGYVKLIAEAATNRIIGATIVSSRASDMISEAALAIEMGSTLDDIALTIHPHPSFGESFMEAAAAGLNSAIHILNRKKI